MTKNAINRPIFLLMLLGAMFTWVSGAWAMESDPLTAEEFPSASQCAVCHKQIYDEWSSSNHAYSSISPMFHKFEQKISDLTQGTIGTFCVRCHQAVGTTLGEDRDQPLWERSRVSSEGVTCITCHRIATTYNKSNGERRIVTGDIHQPIYGPLGGEGVKEVVDNKGYYKVATNPDERGAKIHTAGVLQSQLSESSFCYSCHQVAVNIGIKLEVVVDQYRASPAIKEGISCQDCHMGKVPGRAEGYATGPVAVINNVEINPGRQHSNHAFYGPGYPIAHPGVFPHNPDSEAWTMDEWLRFNYRAGWGTEEFEEALEESGEDYEFPEVWGRRIRPRGRACHHRGQSGAARGKAAASRGRDEQRFADRRTLLQ